MKEIFINYIIILYQDVPTDIYKGMFWVFCLSGVLMMFFFGIKRGLRYSLELLLLEYVLLLFCSTVIFRSYNVDHGYNFHPFWSYAMVQDGGVDLLTENILNLVAFIPVGTLLGIVFKQIQWWEALLIGAGISTSIEFLQFVLARGFSEMDDVMHNSLVAKSEHVQSIRTVKSVS